MRSDDALPATPEPYDPQTAHTELRAIRQELQLSQPQYGTLLGCDPTLISHYEAGRRGVPIPVLYLARTLLDRPRAELPPLPAPKARKFRRLLRWDVAFVLVQPLTPETQCWHGRDPATDDEKAPCSEGVRLQLTALLAPSPRAERRYSQTITCEQHAVEALFWLKKHHRKWTAATANNRSNSWRRRWLEMLRRIGEPAPPPKPPFQYLYTGRPGRPRKVPL